MLLTDNLGYYQKDWHVVKKIIYPLIIQLGEFK